MIYRKVTSTSEQLTAWLQSLEHTQEETWASFAASRERPDAQFDAIVGFIDMRGFSEMTRGKSPVEVCEIARPFIECVIKSATRHLCMVDKTIGDEVMLVMPCFGPEVKAQSAGYEWPDRDNPLPCFAEFLVDLVHDLKEAIPRLAFSSGFAFGRVLLATVGTTEHCETTVYGNCVNAAKRLQSYVHSSRTLWLRLLEWFNPVMGSAYQYRVAIGAMPLDMPCDSGPFLTEVREWARAFPLAHKLRLQHASFSCRSFKGVGKLCYLTADLSTGTST